MVILTGELEQQKAFSPLLGTARHRHDMQTLFGVLSLSLPLKKLPPTGLGAVLRRGRRGGWLLQLLVNIDGFAAFGVEHDIERRDALVLPGESVRRWTIAEQRWRRPFPLLLGLLLQLA